jgi:hypothetical protein
LQDGFAQNAIALAMNENNLLSFLDTLDDFGVHSVGLTDGYGMGCEGLVAEGPYLVLALAIHNLHILAHGFLGRGKAESLVGYGEHAAALLGVDGNVGKDMKIVDCKGKNKVWTLNGNTLTAHPVTIGQSDGINTEITKGLKQGDKIVTEIVVNVPEEEDAPQQSQGLISGPGPRGKKK